MESIKPKSALAEPSGKQSADTGAWKRKWWNRRDKFRIAGTRFPLFRYLSKFSSHQAQKI